MRKLLLATFVAVAPATVVQAQGDAANYPSKPIRLIMPNAPGSANDTLGRIFAAKLGDALGHQMVIDNRAGAGGILGMEIGKTATPDGYTLLAASTAAMSIAPHIHAKLPYDPLQDYEFISTFGVTPNTLVINPEHPVRTVPEFLEYVKAHGLKLNMASAGAGSQSHLVGAMLMQAAGFQSTHVPYKGGGASVLSVVANESHWTITPAPAVMPHIKSGKLRVLGHSLTQRTPLLADVPSIAESVPGFEYSGWNGLLAPRKTPPAVLAKLRETLLKVAASEDLIKLFTAQGAIVQTSTPEQFRALVEREIEHTGKAARAAGLKVE